MSIDNGEPKSQQSGSVSADIQTWHKYKAERNWLSAIVIAESFQKSWALRPSRPPYGLTQDSRFIQSESKDYLFDPVLIDDKQPTIYTHVGRGMHTTLHNDLISFAKELDRRADDDQTKRAYTRLQAILPGGIWEIKRRPLSADDLTAYQFRATRKEDYSVGTFFISRGIGTATSANSNFWDTIVKLHVEKYGYPLFADELIPVGKRSYSVLSKMAAGNIEQVVAAISAITLEANTHRWDSKYFKLDEDERGPKLALVSELWETLIKEKLKIDVLESETDSCPALVASSKLPFEITEYPNVVRGMFNWYCDIIASFEK